MGVYSGSVQSRWAGVMLNIKICPNRFSTQVSLLTTRPPLGEPAFCLWSSGACLGQAKLEITSRFPCLCVLEEPKPLGKQCSLVLTRVLADRTPSPLPGGWQRNPTSTLLRARKQKGRRQQGQTRFYQPLRMKMPKQMELRTNHEMSSCPV